MFRHRPYVKYASNGLNTVHIVYTEGHPRISTTASTTSITARGVSWRSDGKFLWQLGDGMKEPEEGQRIFQGDANNVALVSDLHLDSLGRPLRRVLGAEGFAGLPPGEGGPGLPLSLCPVGRRAMADSEIAYGGSKLYSGEDDYSGLIALDPRIPIRPSSRPMPIPKPGRRWSVSPTASGIGRSSAGAGRATGSPGPGPQLRAIRRPTTSGR